MGNLAGASRWVARRISPVWLSLLAPLVATPAFAQQSYRLGAPPAWVVPRDIRETVEGAKSPPRGGVRLVGLDAQVNIAERPATTYWRVVQRIVSEPGLSTLSTISAEIDPTYERIIFHHVDVRRGPITTTRLSRDAIRVAQRERGLERDVVDGLQTVTLFVEDLRVGDELDFAYSVRGDDPTVGGYFAGSYRLASFAPSSSVGLRFLSPTSRPLTVFLSSPDGQLGSLEPSIETRGALTLRTWSLADTPAFGQEAEAPPGTLAYPLAHVSEFPSWAKVAELATRHHQPPPRSPGIAAWVKEARIQSPSDDALVLKASRFVQDEIRYVGMELGMGRRVPTPPDNVLRRRYGDCKDKAGVLVAILREAGIEAHPALVSSTGGERLDAEPPSLGSFDHVIVRTRSQAGKTLWIDATDTLVGGDLSRFETEVFRRALVLTPGANALTDIPLPTVEAPSIETVVHVNVPAPESKDDVVIDVERTFRGPAAERRRRTLRSSPDESSNGNIDEWKQELPEARSTGAVERRDDRDANVLVSKTFLRAPGFWRPEAGSTRLVGPVYAHDVMAILDAPTADPEGTTRRSPYFLGFRDRRTVKMIVHLPFKLTDPKEDQVARSPEAVVTLKTTLEGNTLTYDYDARREIDRVAAKEGARVRKDFEEAAKLVSRELTWSPPAQPLVPPVLGTIWIVLGAIVGVVLGLSLLVMTNDHDPATQRYVPTRRFDRLGGLLWPMAIPVVLAPLGKAYVAFTTVKSLVAHDLWAVAFTYSASEIAVPCALCFVVSVLLVASPLQAIAVARLFLARRATFPQMFAIQIGLTLAVAALDDLAGRSWPNPEKVSAEWAQPHAFWLLALLCWTFHADRSLGTFLQRRSGALVAESPRA